MTTPSPTNPATFDDVMLAMDVVDTLRHQQSLAKRELAGEVREADLIKRLKDIYHAQGIEVPEAILQDGVKALQEHRFVYTPPKPSFSTKLATWYVKRDRWLKPVVYALLFTAALWTVQYILYERPRQQAQQAQIEALQTTIPQRLVASRKAALAMLQGQRPQEPALIQRVESLFQQGRAAVKANNYQAAESAATELTKLMTALRQTYTIRVVSRPGEYSGVFRIPENNPRGRNYYVIVEAIQADGQRTTVPITSEEDQTTHSVNTWGVRVPEYVFRQIAADKADDQIIQNPVIGEKRAGTLMPKYTIPVSSPNGGGNIVSW